MQKSNVTLKSSSLPGFLQIGFIWIQPCLRLPPETFDINGTSVPISCCFAGRSVTNVDCLGRHLTTSLSSHINNLLLHVFICFLLDSEKPDVVLLIILSIGINIEQTIQLGARCQLRQGHCGAPQPHKLCSSEDTAHEWPISMPTCEACGQPLQVRKRP